MRNINITLAAFQEEMIDNWILQNLRARTASRLTYSTEVRYFDFSTSLCKEWMSKFLTTWTDEARFPVPWFTDWTPSTLALENVFLNQESISPEQVQIKSTVLDWVSDAIKVISKYGLSYKYRAASSNNETMPGSISRSFCLL